jgi:hypothetical protein
MMKQLLLVAAMLLAPALASAENYGGLPDRFFGLIKQGKHDEAIDYLAGSNPWLAKNADDMVQLRGKLSRTEALFGKYMFHELVAESHVGVHYVHQIYVIGYERQPVRCKLVLYKPGVSWRVNNVSFDSNLIDDIDKQADARIVK